MGRSTDQQFDPRTAIAMARRLRGRQTQQELADELSRERGESWTRVMIAKLESGDKRLEVDVLLSIAKVQDMPIGWYLEPPQSTRAKGVQITSPVPVAA